MKAVVCHETKLEVAEVPDPVPGPGQVLLEVVRGGICGSDLHARKHADQLADLAAAIGYDDVMRPARVGGDGPRVQRPGARLRPGHPEGLGDRHAGRVAADDPDGRQGADDRPVGQGARGVRRAACSSRSPSRWTCPTGSPPRRPRSPSRWRSPGTPYAAAGCARRRPRSSSGAARSGWP